MSEILARFGDRGGTRGAYWLILACGHWYKWAAAGEGTKPPKVGVDFRCPDCTPLPTVSR